MQLPATKYPTTQRIVSGTVNVYPDDVILYCDTSKAPVVINLLDIPLNNFSVQYRLTVVDLSNNASTNNITINAGLNELITPNVQQTINGQNSLVLNVNKAEALIEISSGLSNSTQTKFSYIATISYSSAPPTPTGFIEVTYLELLTLTGSETIIPDADYLLIDANFGDSPIIPTKVYLKGMTTNEVTNAGQGIFFNADYQTVGDYSGILGFAGQLGIWNPSLTTPINSVVIWNNFHWQNITGTNNSKDNPSIDSNNWTKLAYSTTNGYIVEIDTVQYDIGNNYIVSRRDIRDNYVYCSSVIGYSCFNNFKWGDNKVGVNELIGSNILNLCNTEITNYFVDNSFEISNITLDISSGNSLRNFTSNNIESLQATITCNIADYVFNTIKGLALELTLGNDSSFSNNFIYNSTIKTTLGIQSNFEANKIQNSQIFVASLTGDFQNNEIFNSGITVVNQNGNFWYNTFEKNVTINIENNKNLTENNWQETHFSVSTNSDTIERNTINNSILTITTQNGFFRGNTLISIQATFGTNKDFTNNTFNQGVIEIPLNENNISVNNSFDSNIRIVNEGNGEFSNNNLKTSDLNIESNKGTISTNTFNNSTFGIINENSGIIKYNDFLNNSNFIMQENLASGIISQNVFSGVTSIINFSNNGIIESNTFINVLKFEIIGNEAEISHNEAQDTDSFRIQSVNLNEIMYNSVSFASLFTVSGTGNNGSIKNNSITQTSTLNITDNDGDISFNSISSNSLISVLTNTFNATVGYNNLSTASQLIIGNNSGKIGSERVYGNTFTNTSIVTLTSVFINVEFYQNEFNASELTISDQQGNFVGNTFNKTSTILGTNKDFLSNILNQSTITIPLNEFKVELNQFTNASITIDKITATGEFTQNQVSNTLTLFTITEQNGVFTRNIINNSSTSFGINNTFSDNIINSGFVRVFLNEGYIQVNKINSTTITLTVDSTGIVNYNNFEKSDLLLQSISGQFNSNNFIHNGTITVNNGMNGMFTLARMSFNHFTNNIYGINISNGGLFENNEIEQSSGTITIQNQSNISNFSRNTINLNYNGVTNWSNLGDIVDNYLVGEFRLNTANVGSISNNRIEKLGALKIETNLINGHIAYNTIINGIIEITSSNYGLITSNILDTVPYDFGVSKLEVDTNGSLIQNNRLLGSKLELTLNLSKFSDNLFTMSNITIGTINMGQTIQRVNLEYSQMNIFNLQSSGVNKGIFNLNASNSIIDINILEALTRISDISLNQSNFNIISTNDFSINNLNLTQTTFNFPTLTQDYIDKYADPINSNIQEELDMTDPAVFDAGTGTLTVDTNKGNVAGILRITKPVATPISKIITTAPREIMFIPDTGTVTFDSETIATASNDEIISNQGTFSYLITYRPDGYDSINIKRQGIYNVVKSYNIFT